LIVKVDEDGMNQLAITPELRDEMVRFIKKRIIRNLEASKRFLELKDEDYNDICAGLHTYAVEEYGKMLFLERLNPSPLQITKSDSHIHIINKVFETMTISLNSHCTTKIYQILLRC
jgi:hypothetical protein